MVFRPRAGKGTAAKGEESVPWYSLWKENLPLFGVRWSVTPVVVALHPCPDVNALAHFSCVTYCGRLDEAISWQRQLIDALGRPVLGSALRDTLRCSASA